MTLLLLVLLFAPGHDSPAEAQVRIVRYGDDRLTGIREVDVLVEADTSVEGCRVTRGALEKGALDSLARAGIKASLSAKARSWHHSVVLHLTTRREAGLCATAVRTELVAEVAGIPEADRDLPAGTWGSMLIGPMPLRRHESLVITPGLEHDTSVLAAARAQVESLAAEVRSRNP